MSDHTADLKSLYPCVWAYSSRACPGVFHCSRNLCFARATLAFKRKSLLLSQVFCISSAIFFSSGDMLSRIVFFRYCDDIIGHVTNVGIRSVSRILSPINAACSGVGLRSHMYFFSSWLLFSSSSDLIAVSIAFSFKELSDLTLSYILSLASFMVLFSVSALLSAEYLLLASFTMSSYQTSWDQFADTVGESFNLLLNQSMIVLWSCIDNCLSYHHSSHIWLVAKSIARSNHFHKALSNKSHASPDIILSWISFCWYVGHKILDIKSTLFLYTSSFLFLSISKEPIKFVVHSAAPANRSFIPSQMYFAATFGFQNALVRISFVGNSADSWTVWTNGDRPLSSFVSYNHGKTFFAVSCKDLQNHASGVELVVNGPVSILSACSANDSLCGTGSWTSGSVTLFWDWTGIVICTELGAGNIVCNCGCCWTGSTAFFAVLETDEVTLLRRSFSSQPAFFRSSVVAISTQTF